MGACAGPRTLSTSPLDAQRGPRQTERRHGFSTPSGSAPSGMSNREREHAV
jgi:hypothetical protein